MRYSDDTLRQMGAYCKVIWDEYRPRSPMHVDQVIALAHHQRVFDLAAKWGEDAQVMMRFGFVGHADQIQRMAARLQSGQPLSGRTRRS